MEASLRHSTLRQVRLTSATVCSMDRSILCTSTSTLLQGREEQLDLPYCQLDIDRSVGSGRLSNEIERLTSS